MHYRREIDGLRAVAVLPVILFHAGIGPFSGGFVGVDVFFVISGYLITAILIGDLERGDFSLWRFYERRARRILPALGVVILAALPFAWAWMTPAELVDFGESIGAVMVFLSNLLFAIEAGYFDTTAEMKPLLHTWSLAVEEQFYLVFPLLLLGLWRLARRRVAGALILLALGSLVWAQWSLAQDGGRAFYLTPGRAWELLAGALCALHLRGRAGRPQGVLAALGLGLILGAALLFDRGTPFPGISALVPVAGAVLVVLFAHPGTFAARLLSTRPMVGIGLISYSAYLWHQPIFAFARLRQVEAPGLWQMAALCVLALALAWASWASVEQPFRRVEARWLPQRRQVFLASGMGMVGLLAVGLVLRQGEGFPTRFPPALQQIAAAADDRVDNRCIRGPWRKLPPHPVAGCAVPDAAGGTQVLILSDSQGRELAAVLGPMLQARGIGSYATGYLGCPPLPGLLRADDSDYDCDGFMRGALDYAEGAGIDTVVLIGRHGFYLHGTRFDNGEGGVEWGDSGAADTLAGGPEGARAERVLAGYEAGIRALAGRFKVVLVDPVPEAGWEVPQTLFRRQVFGAGGAVLDTAHSAYLARQAPILALLQSLAAELPGVRQAPITQLLCPTATGRCRNADAAGILYMDDVHLSLTGARLVAPVIAQTVEDLRAGR